MHMCYWMFVCIEYGIWDDLLCAIGFALKVYIQQMQFSDCHVLPVVLQHGKVKSWFVCTDSCMWFHMVTYGCMQMVA